MKPLIIILCIACCFGNKKPIIKEFKILKIDSLTNDLFHVYLRDLKSSKIYGITTIERDHFDKGELIKEGSTINLLLKRAKLDVKIKESTTPKYSHESFYCKDLYEGEKVNDKYYSPCLNGLYNNCNAELH